MARLVLPLVVVLSLAVAPLHVHGQATGEANRYSLVVIRGSPSAGPAAEVEDAMIRGGFDDDTQCWLFCQGTIAHPFSRTGMTAVGSSWLLELSYRLWARAGVGLTWARTEIGTTLGYRSGSDFSNSDHLFIEYGVTTVASTIVLMLKPLRLEVGPALHVTEAWQDDVGQRVEVRRSYRPGLMAGAGLSVPLYRALHIEARAQYRYTGRGTVGPFTTDAATLSEFDADFSHTYLGFGLGLRF